MGTERSVGSESESRTVDPRLFGVLVTFRRPAQLERTLARLRAQTRPLDRLVVVDNGSSRKVEDLVDRESPAGVRYVDAGENLGPAGGYALGMRLVLEEAGDQDWVFALDDDDPPFFDDAFEQAARFATGMVEQDPDTGGVGISGGRFDWRRGRVVRIGDAEIQGPVPVDHITGGGLPAYRVGAVRDVGVFRGDLFFGFEELEYGLRMGAGGYRLYADGDQWIIRKRTKRNEGLLPPEEASAARTARARVTQPTWRRYYSLRNLIVVLRSAGATGTAVRVTLTRGIVKPLANLLLSPRAAWGNLASNARAVRDGWQGNLGRTIDPS